MKIIIDKAEKAIVGDFVIIPVFGSDYDSGVHTMGIVSQVSYPHTDIVEFTMNVMANINGKKGIQTQGVRLNRKIGIIRNEAK